MRYNPGICRLLHRGFTGFDQEENEIAQTYSFLTFSETMLKGAHQLDDDVAGAYCSIHLIRPPCPGRDFEEVHPGLVPLCQQPLAQCAGKRDVTARLRQVMPCRQPVLIALLRLTLLGSLSIF